MAGKKKMTKKCYHFFKVPQNKVNLYFDPDRGLGLPPPGTSSQSLIVPSIQTTCAGAFKGVT